MISVIVPIYNVSLYLRCCIESILNQTYTDLEIILVDDGSTDNSGIICDEYSLKDSRIRVIHQKNQGQSVARNKGIELAKGDWISFIDSDDWIEPTFYETFIELSSKYECDIFSCDFRYRNNEVILSQSNDKLTVVHYDLDSLIRGLLPNDPNIKFVVWNKLWKRSLIDNIRFTTGQICEEIAFDRQIFLRSKGLVHINKTLYNYRQNREGNTSSSFKLARMCVIDEFKEFINDLDKLGKPELGDIVTIVAAEHLIDYYNSAIIFHQSKTIRKKIFHGFLIFYKRISVNRINCNKDIILFRFFPTLYLRLKYIYHSIKKRLK